MNHQIKTAFFWLLLGVCFITHTIFYMYGLLYGADIRLPDSNGAVSLEVQAFNSVIFTLTFLLAFISAVHWGKVFRWISLVWSILFLLLNIVHLGMTAFAEAFDLSQICLLTFVPVVNIWLILSLLKSLRKDNHES
jgi:hypothetical protein